MSDFKWWQVIALVCCCIIGGYIGWQSEYYISGRAKADKMCYPSVAVTRYLRNTKLTSVVCSDKTTRWIDKQGYLHIEVPKR